MACTVCSSAICHDLFELRLRPQDREFWHPTGGSRRYKSIFGFIASRRNFDLLDEREAGWRRVCRGGRVVEACIVVIVDAAKLPWRKRCPRANASGGLAETTADGQGNADAFHFGLIGGELLFEFSKLVAVLLDQLTVEERLG